MNQFGSYRALFGNSKSAILAAIEIYNKPKFEYRSECFVILLLNAWELMFKAILSKNRIRIYETKEKGKPYRTLSLFDAMKSAAKYLPANVPPDALFGNIDRLTEYRNNAVHFYNEDGIETVMYGLSQTSIVNFRDIANSVFSIDIANEVNICLLPLSFSAPPDPISFLGQASKHKPEVAEFMASISGIAQKLEAAKIDTARFLTVFSIQLQSVKKIQHADIVVGIDPTKTTGTLIATQKIDPNKSHPHTSHSIINEIGSTLRGIKFNSHTFQAIAWNYKLKENPNMCWKNNYSKTFQYSDLLILFLKGLTETQITESIINYKQRSDKQ